MVRFHYPMIRAFAFFSVLSLGIGAPALVLSGCASTGSKKKLSSTEKARLYVEVANSALLEGDSTTALENLFLAEKESDSLPELYHSRALAYILRKETALALDSARRSVELAPNYSDANMTYGKLLMDSGKVAEAIAPLTRASQDPLNREAYKAYTSLGILYYRRGDATKARESLERAISAVPGQACIAYYYRGHLNLKESRVREAISDYDQATRRFCAEFADAHLALGIAYEKNSQYELARKKFLEIQERYPSTAVADQAMKRMRFLP